MVLSFTKIKLIMIGIHKLSENHMPNTSDGIRNFPLPWIVGNQLAGSHKIRNLIDFQSYSINFFQTDNYSLWSLSATLITHLTLIIYVPGYILSFFFDKFFHFLVPWRDFGSTAWNNKSCSCSPEKVSFSLLAAFISFF